MQIYADKLETLNESVLFTKNIFYKNERQLKITLEIIFLYSEKTN